MDQLSSRFHEALSYASTLHADQARKGERGIPYVAHLLGVTARVMKAGGNEDQAIAALLHDSLEDQGHKTTEEEIRVRYGAVVARLVVRCTDATAEEKKQMDWWERKRKYLHHISSLDPDAMLVVIADKLENACDTAWDYRVFGEEIWSRFSEGRNGEEWFYGEVVGVVDLWLANQPRQSPAFHALVEELRQILSGLKGATG